EEDTDTLRRRWPTAKIVLLFEKVSATDLQKLLAAEVDACISLLASPRTLIGTLQLIVCEHLRVVMMSDAHTARVLPGARPRLDHAPGHAPQGREVPVAQLSRPPSLAAAVRPTEIRLLGKEAVDAAVRSVGGHGLSEREEQILKALVRGHSNKLI